MKIDGLEWMDWLHKMREREYESAKNSGKTLNDYMKEAGEEAARISKEQGIKLTGATKTKS